MTSFVLTFRNAVDCQVTEAIDALWGQWFQELGSAIVDPGSQVGKTRTLGAAPSSTVVSGYTVIAADDLESAVLLAKGCPGLQHGGAVEVGEFIGM